MEYSALSHGVKRALAEGEDERRLAEQLRETGYEPITAHAERLVEQGVTDRAELARVLGHGADGLEDLAAEVGGG